MLVKSEIPRLMRPRARLDSTYEVDPEQAPVASMTDVGHDVPLLFMNHTLEGFDEPTQWTTALVVGETQQRFARDGVSDPSELRPQARGRSRHAGFSWPTSRLPRPCGTAFPGGYALALASIGSSRHLGLKREPGDQRGDLISIQQQRRNLNARKQFVGLT